MNVVVLTDFNESAAQLIKDAAPNTVLHFYPTTRLSVIPAGVLAAMTVFYTYGPLPTAEEAPNLKWVQAHSAGVDHLVGNPLFAGKAADTGIKLTTASGVHGINIAEYSVMMMLGLAHHLPVAFRMMQRGEWDGNRTRFVPAELYGATVGLIGYGAIGQRTAQVCKGLGMHVLAMRRAVPSQDDPDGVSFYHRDQLRAFLGECDYVVLTAPLTPETYRIIDGAALAAMKRSACLVNIARGDLVDEEALIAALSDGTIAGAALDVFMREPLPMDSPLWRMDNVIMTPHIAGITPNYERRAADLFAANLRRYQAGEPLVNQVDFARGY
jgi:phosphoglycerate dehydrogenase-like enzyme